MSTLRWLGSTTNIRQIATLAISNDGTNWSTGDTITLTCNNATFVVTVGSTVTTAGIATTVKEALAGASSFTDTAASSSVALADGGATIIPMFAEVTATVSSSTVTLTTNQTGPTPYNGLIGKPFTFTASKSSTHGTITYTNAATSPASQFGGDQAANYSGGAAPANNDTLVFDSGAVDMRYGLSLGVQLAAIKKYACYTGNVGLGKVNNDSTSKPYAEYRTDYLTTTNNTVTTTADLEIGAGQGSGRFKWDAGAGQVLLTIYGKGAPADTGIPCILFKGTHASNVVNNLRGDLGIAFFGGETATVATLVTGDSPTSAANTICGSGCTLTTVTVNGGTQETNSAVTTANQFGGSWNHKSGTVTTANIYAGATHYPNGSATYTTINLYGGTFDCTRGAASFTITNTVQLYKGAKFIDPAGRAGNVVFKLNGCQPSDVTIIFPANKTYTLS